jgi:hypothetical protein
MFEVEWNLRLSVPTLIELSSQHTNNLQDVVNNSDVAACPKLKISQLHNVPIRQQMSSTAAQFVFSWHVLLLVVK